MKRVLGGFIRKSFSGPEKLALIHGLRLYQEKIKLLITTSLSEDQLEWFTLEDQGINNLIEKLQP